MLPVSDLDSSLKYSFRQIFEDEDGPGGLYLQSLENVTLLANESERLIEQSISHSQAAAVSYTPAAALERAAITEWQYFQRTLCRQEGYLACQALAPVWTLRNNTLPDLRAAVKAVITNALHNEATTF